LNNFTEHFGLDLIDGVNSVDFSLSFQDNLSLLVDIKEIHFYHNIIFLVKK